MFGRTSIASDVCVSICFGSISKNWKKTNGFISKSQPLTIKTNHLLFAVRRAFREHFTHAQSQQLWFGYAVIVRRHRECFGELVARMAKLKSVVSTRLLVSRQDILCVQLGVLDFSAWMMKFENLLTGFSRHGSARLFRLSIRIRCQ